MKAFRHYHVKSVSAAVALLETYGGNAKIIAGGTDLLGVLKDNILPASPEVVVNLKEIRSLDYIREDNDVLKIGALTKLSNIAASAFLKEKYAALADAAESVATPVLRNMATIGGNLCQDTRCWYYRYPHEIGGRLLCYRKGGKKCPAVAGDNRYHAILGGKRCFSAFPSDTAVALTALDATLKIVSPASERLIPVREFYTPLGNVLEVNEIVTEILVPRPKENTRQKFLKFTFRKPLDFAIVSVASVIGMAGQNCTDAGIALGAVAPFPYRSTEAENAIIGKRINEDTVLAACDKSVKSAKPLAMNSYKVTLTKLLIKRALLEEEGCE